MEGCRPASSNQPARGQCSKACAFILVNFLSVVGGMTSTLEDLIAEEIHNQNGCHFNMYTKRNKTCLGASVHLRHFRYRSHLQTSCGQLSRHYRHMPSTLHPCTLCWHTPLSRHATPSPRGRVPGPGKHLKGNLFCPPNGTSLTLKIWQLLATHGHKQEEINSLWQKWNVLGGGNCQGNGNP